MHGVKNKASAVRSYDRLYTRTALTSAAAPFSATHVAQGRPIYLFYETRVPSPA